MSRPWEHALPEHWGPLQSGGSIDFTQPSPRIAVSAAVREVAAEVFWPQRPLGECLAALTALIHTEFTYDSQATTVTSTLEEVLAARHGVCQDFAHRSEEHTSELQSRGHLVCRPLLATH